MWAWVNNGIRLSSSLILLPLLTIFLPPSDLGYYWILASLTSMVPLVDLGFGSAIGRSVSYAMGGASEITAQGIAQDRSEDGKPNYILLKRLLSVTRLVYRWLALVGLVVFGLWGSFWTNSYADQTSMPNLTWLAWVLTLIAAVADVYSGWWNIYMRGLNLVLLSARISSAVAIVRLIIAGSLIATGAGLMSLPIATLATSFLQRQLSRHHVLKYLSNSDNAEPSWREEIILLRNLWPSCWRVGVHCLGYYLAPHAMTLICASVLGLQANAQYGISIQIISIVQSMTMVWLTVKWPEFGQLCVRGDLITLRRRFRTRLLLQLASFAVISFLAVVLSSDLLEAMRSGKSVLPVYWFGLLAVASFLDLHSNSWVSLIALGNRLPFIWHSVITNLTPIVLALFLVRIPSLGVGGLVLAPLLPNLLCNYWHWPKEGARVLKTSWTKLIFSHDN